LSKRQNFLGPLSKSFKRIQVPFLLDFGYLGGASTSSASSRYLGVPCHLI
jgi:hypothetical protein